MVTISSLAWKAGPREPSERLLYLALAEHADERGHCYPGVDLLAEKTCQTRRNVTRVMDKLVGGGWVRVQKVGRNHEYDLDLSKLCGEVTTNKLSNDERLFIARWTRDKLSPIGRVIGDKLSPIQTRTRDNLSHIVHPIGDISNADRGHFRHEHGTSATKIGDNFDSYIENRQEPSLEPSRGTVREKQRPPSSSSESLVRSILDDDYEALARAMFEELAISAPDVTVQLAAGAIRMQSSASGVSPREAMVMIRDRAKAASQSGETVNRFWFEDSKWKAPVKAPPLHGALEPNIEIPETPPSGTNLSLGEQIWESMKKEAKKAIGPQRFETWLGPIKARGVHEGLLYLQIPSDDFAHIPNRYDLSQYLPASVREIRILNGHEVSA